MLMVSSSSPPQSGRIPSEEELIKLAKQAQRRAYAPYSRFPVGAALLAVDGRVFVGCNVENSSLGLTSCAERNAVYTAVVNGCTKFLRLVVVTNSREPTMPCGVCRQVLWEFSPELEVIAVGGKGRIARAALSDLLPQGFRFTSSGDADR